MTALIFFFWTLLTRIDLTTQYGTKETNMNSHSRSCNSIQNAQMATSSQSSTLATELGLKLTHNILRVRNSNELIKFYENNFGMENTKISTTSSPHSVSVLGYTTNYDENFNKASSAVPPPTLLELHHSDSLPAMAPVNSGSSKIYWKIGITLYDVDYAQKVLQSKRISVSGASQFEDIGYLCHLSDPNGYGIEMLQHDFEDTFRSKINKTGRQPPNNTFPLGYPCCIGQITLHSNDIKKTQGFYQDLLGMKLLSIQEVSQYGFTLYFFAWTNENPPKSDVRDASVNREWLWKRPYTTLEIRHFHSQGRIPPYRDLQENEIGFEGLRITCNDLNAFITKMQERNIRFKESNGAFGREIVLRDPDNIPIYVSQDKCGQ